MSWLVAPHPVRTLDEAGALRADLWRRHHRLQEVLAGDPTLSPDVRARAEARVATLCGVASAAPAPQGAGDVVLEFVEQYVLDPHGVTDELVARLAATLSPRGVVALTMAVAVWEGGHRLAHALDVVPSP